MKKEEIENLTSIERFHLAEQIARQRFYSGEKIFRGEKGVAFLLEIIEKKSNMKSIKKIMQQDYITSEEYQRIKSLLSCTYIWDTNTNLYKKVSNPKFKKGSLVKSKLDIHDKLTTWIIKEINIGLSGKTTYFCKAKHDTKLNYGFDSISRDFEGKEIELF